MLLQRVFVLIQTSVVGQGMLLHLVQHTQIHCFHHPSPKHTNTSLCPSVYLSHKWISSFLMHLLLSHINFVSQGDRADTVGEAHYPANLHPFKTALSLLCTPFSSPYYPSFLFINVSHTIKGASLCVQKLPPSFRTFL